MQVIERYTLTGADTLAYEATVTDPKIFTQPWKVRTTLERRKEPGARIIEDECMEGASGARHHVSPLAGK